MDKDAANVRMTLQCLFHRFGLYCLAPFHPQFMDCKPVTPSDLSPTFAELPAVDYEHLFTRREQVGDRGFHGSRA
ncbi:hypothetical protein HRbin30_02494 [bacterium HR30]|nr:hypothetical protein HRbin30_02494 [bacterium HR30]